MASNRRKGPREKDLTSRYMSGDWDEDRIDAQQRFSDRSKGAEQDKIEKTALLRAAEQETSGGADVEILPVGQVIQVHSLFSEVEHATGVRLCVIRKTLARLSETSIVVGDRVRFRDSGTFDEQGRPEAVIEQILPRDTILTRTKGGGQHPIVANADQMLIVASLQHPRVKWGLVDRMIVAAQSGKLTPIVCLNKIDLSEDDEDVREATDVLRHYESLDITTIQTSAASSVGIAALRERLRGKTTVLAGHSGVGKSSLIGAVQPGLDIRVGLVSEATNRGIHTTTSARRYVLPDLGGAAVIDTPGVKVFGLWAVTRDNLIDYFPDVAEDRAPQWRVESYQRIHDSLS